MSTPSTPSFIDLLPELFPVIIENLPLVYRPSTLLSLALTCHRLHEVVFPELVYSSVRLVGEDQALTTLDIFIAKAELVTEHDIQRQGNPSPSHCIHHLCLSSTIKIPIRTRSSLDALEKLVEVNGLRHLSSLTLQVSSNWDGTDFDDFTGYITLSSSFCSSLKTKCPNLKRIQLSSDLKQEVRREWIEPHIFSLKGLTSIRIESELMDYPTRTINFSQLPSNLHTLELRIIVRLTTTYQGQAIDGNELLGCIFPNLRVLILDEIFISDRLSTNAFWRAHPGIERLELHSRVVGTWFNSDFQVGMLPNLKYLLCNADHALVLLPRVSTQFLISLAIWDTYNAQGTYLLRVACRGGVLPALRSLSIHSESRDRGTEDREGLRWREDVDGNVSIADLKKPARQFDGNYIMSLSKAAPNLEELELLGWSNDTLASFLSFLLCASLLKNDSMQASLTTSLSMFSRLHRLTLSGAINGSIEPFFPCCVKWEEYAEWDLEPEHTSKYAPVTFDEAVRDLANGCRTLEVITMGTRMGELSLRDGLSRKVVRECDGGVVTQLKKAKALGNIIGREDEW